MSKNIYLLAGIGIGITIASAIFYFTLEFNKDSIAPYEVQKDVSDMTDDEVLERASELGMIFFDESYKFEDETDADKTDVSKTDDDKSDTNTTNENSETKEDDNTILVEEDFVDFYIPKGIDSYSACEILYDVGLIDDVQMFEDLLTINGVDKSIRTGNFRVRVDIKDADLIKILTGKGE